MSTFELPDFLVLAAASTYVLAYLVINQVILRIIILAGTVLYIGYYATAADQPLWTAIWTSVAILIANMIGLTMLLASRWQLSLPRAFADIYQNNDAFRALTPGDFRMVMQTANREVVEIERTLCKEHQPSDTLYYILNGSARVTKLGQSFDLPSNVFVGEVAYLLQRNSAATITLDAGSEVLAWKFNALRARSKRKIRFKLALEALIARDLAAKVVYAVAPDIMRP